MTFGLVRAYLVLNSPVTTSFPSSLYWGIDATIRYGGNNTTSLGLVNNKAGIVDTGTTLLFLSTSKSLRDSRLLPDMCTQILNT